MARKFLITAAAAAVAVTGTLFAATSAVAAPEPAASTKAVSPSAYNGVCGSGYEVIDSLKLSGGTTYLTYNSSTGKNCVVTVRTTTGSKIYMGAAIQFAGDSSSTVFDYGYYTAYAGPVYLKAAGKCIDWYGQIDDSFNQQYDSHCG